jgi:predicted AlkP superfamily phosphohydrolase/phosphomutase
MINTLIIGLDAFEPETFEQLYNEGVLPNLGKFADTGGYGRLSISNPAQSEVSWTSIATGANPGWHGIFDFVHRDPSNYQLYASLLPTKKDFVGIQFIPPHSSRTIFEEATRQGYPATSLWWPATFPARLDLPVRSIPGLGAPDIHGFLGVGTVFTCDRQLKQEGFKTRVEIFTKEGRNRYRGYLKGPEQHKRGNITYPKQYFQLEMVDDERANLIIGKNQLTMKVGIWSPIFEISFNLGIFFNIRAITRAILTHSEPYPTLYFLPLQIHPLKSPWRYATPAGFIRQTWKNTGPFLTLGWPQDTTALEEKWIDDNQFIDLCNSIIDSRERVFQYHLEYFYEGLLGAVFDTLDRVQHMYWRERKDIVHGFYKKLDGLVGRAIEKIKNEGNKSTRIIILSDHGFCNFDYKIHLNRWLIEKGYLVSSSNKSEARNHDMDWGKSKAYAVGLNSLYINLSGREAEGSVLSGELEILKESLRTELLAWKGPDGRHIIHQVYNQNEVLEGPYSHKGPDLLVGYSPGYRASAETGLGGWKEYSIEQNQDHWNADHCVAPEKVPGVLFTNHHLSDYPHPSYKDIPGLAIDMELQQNSVDKPSSYHQGDDEKVIEERMKGLGYF